MRGLRCVFGLLLAGCGAGTEPDTGSGVIDKMFLTDVTQFFSPGSTYKFSAYWRAVDSHGQDVPLDSAGVPIDRGLRYGLGDSLPGDSQSVDSTGAIVLPPFIGFLYVFAPTSRSARERMGQHYIAVQ